MLTLEEFTNKYIGKEIKINDNGKKQSYNVICKYLHECFDIPDTEYPKCPSGSVKDLIEFYYTIEFFKKYDVELFLRDVDDKTNIPEKGDIIVFNSDKYGFTGIVLSATQEQITILAQSEEQIQPELNYNVSIIPNLDYKEVIGWLRCPNDTYLKPSKGTSKVFKENLLKSVLDLKDHMTDFRKSSFVNAIGGSNEDHYFIAKEFREAWDKNVEADKLKSEIQILKTTRDISPNAIGYKAKLDTSFSDSVISAINDNKEPKTVLELPKTSKTKFSINKFLIGSTKDGSLYMLISILLTISIIVLLSNKTNISENKIILIATMVFLSSTLIAFMKCYYAIIKIK
jgi:hypothetical protein